MILIISGCIDFYGTERQRGSSLYKGTKGIEFEFLSKAPPKRVFENQIFDIILRIENEGTYDVKADGETYEGILVITPESGYVDFLEEENIKRGSGRFVKYISEGQSRFNLQGRSIIYSKGEDSLVYNRLRTRELSSLSQLHNSNVFATICYPYQTKLSTDVCIDTDIHNLQPVDKACESKELTYSGGQGAPVAITKIITSIDPLEEDKNEVTFTIYAENRGNGEVTKASEYRQACTSGLLASESTIGLNRFFNLIKVSAKLSNNLEELRCGPQSSGEMVLTGKKGYIKCKAEIEGDRAYTAPLIIEMDYGYTATISKTFDIEASK